MTSPIVSRGQSNFFNIILFFILQGFTVPMTEREVGHAHGYTFAACIISFSVFFVIIFLSFLLRLFF